MYRSRFLKSAIVAVGLSAASLCLAPPLAAQAGFAPGPQYQGRGFGKNKVQYREFEWTIYHSPHFDIYYYTEDPVLLEKVVSFAESAYDRLSRQFDFQIQEPTPLIFYETHAAFEQNNIILNFIPEGVGAFASPVRFRMVLPVDLPDPELMELILHELTHIFQYHILFNGSVTKSLTANPPQWFMEGMASFMAKDESTRDKMFLRDAVVNDRIPPMTRWAGGGFFGYRIGHSVFDFIVEKWGWEGYTDFIYEYRNTIGGSIGRAVERTFRMDPEEFDDEFRLWLRRQYLAELLKTGEPGEFGRPFRGPQGQTTQDTSPVASPSGDLVVALSQPTGDADVVLYDAENRRFLRNLTKGFTNDFQYLVAQEITLGRSMGRDLAFSPDGNSIAVFGRREGGRSLLLLNVLSGGFYRRIDMPDIDQQLSPAWSPDGKTVAFSGWQGGQFDIFLLDLESEEITNLTDDAIFDGSPAFSPDGSSVVFSSVVGEGHAKLFRMDLANAGQRIQLTHGESDDVDAVYSTVSDRVYFTSDRTGVNNIHSLDLDTGELRQWTNVVTGAFTPTVLAEPAGAERLIYTSLWKGRFTMYVADVEEAVGEPEQTELATEPTPVEEIPVFEPDIQVAVNDDDKEPYGGFRLFLEDADTILGLNDDQTFVGRVLLTWSDYLGDKRLFASFASVDSFSNFNVAYLNLSKRRQWALRLFDTRFFSLALVQEDFFDDIERDQLLFRQTGAVASLIYPLSFYTRAEVGAGYIFRKLDAQSFIRDETGQLIPVIRPIDDDFPILEGALAGDSAIFAPWGPISGRRWRLDAFWAPSIGGEESGTVTASVDMDFRQYVPLSRRVNLAWRVFAGTAGGNNPSPFIFGGLDTVRGVRFNSLAGTRAFFTNVEFRFPLIDVLAIPGIAFQGIRGVIFFDLGGAWFHDFQDFDFSDDDNRLQDAVAAYGWGVSLRLFGLDWNWDFARRWDFKDSGDFQTSFWIGTRF